MSRLNAALLVALVLVGCLAISPAAQARWVPGGSYADSCRNIRYDGDALTASCRRSDGSWRNTWLPDAEACEGNIVNDNGQLECATGRERDVDRYDNDGGPSGPYERSCTNIRMEGHTLKATCQRNDGSWRWSELEYAYDCDGRIRNSNGHLVCRGGY